MSVFSEVIWQPSAVGVEQLRLPSPQGEKIRMRNDPQYHTSSKIISEHFLQLDQKLGLHKSSEELDEECLS